MRLSDQPRPVVWPLMRFVSRKYRNSYESRHLADWQRILLRRAYLFPAQEALYLRNAKAASSSLVRFFEQISGGAAAAGPREAPELISPMHDWRQAREALFAEDVYRFTFVRHPARRALSTFNDFFARRAGKRNGYWWRHMPYLQGRGDGPRFGDNSLRNFDLFLDYAEEVLADNPVFCDEHFRTQVRNLYPDKISYRRVGRVETIGADLALILA